MIRMNLEYIALRLARHYVPESIASFMSRRGLVLKKGLETNDPKTAAVRYVKELDLAGKEIAGSVVMNFGYGGVFGTVVELLHLGAKHVYVYDKYTAPNNRRNANLLGQHGEYLRNEGGDILPNPEFITLIENVKAIQTQMDIVLSSSVFEHVEEVDSTIKGLADITYPDGIHIHYIDLRDHFFKYPFNMLCYSEETWERFLNPSSNLNRLRVNDYERIFAAYFGDVQCKIVESAPDSYIKVRDRVRAEFITGDLNRDAATQITVVAKNPNAGAL